MIVHKPKKKIRDLDQPGQILTARVRIVADCKAEIVPGPPRPDGKIDHIGDLKAGEIYDLPVWSARDLVSRGLATTA